ncbi:chaperone [Coemansia javaensis]|uniref:Chaperone n=1 Tax=Coemansia javaensis TaxID=2761396 RepID=A0A9W8H6Q1_9FUNG|nr:chaperone [Coemansia javaensis]
MVVQYTARRAQAGRNGEPDHFGDVMSQRETSCMLPAVFRNPVQRIMLMANGNLQRVLSAYYNLPVSVEVVYNEPEAPLPKAPQLPVRYRRSINLVCNRTIVCSAQSTVDLLTQKAADLVVSGGVGIGQLFRYMNVLPTFTLLEAQLSDTDGSFSRLYELRSQDVACVILEEFPDGMLDPDYCNHRTRQPGAGQAQPGAGNALPKAAAGGIRRFWKDVSVGERDGHYVVLLDKRPVKTPDGQLLRVAAGRGGALALAWLVAGEWEAQREVVGAHSLPLTSLVARSIDGLADAAARRDVVDRLLKYFQTDSACLHDEYPRALVELQRRHYAPILDWARATYGIELRTTADLFALRQAPEAAARLRDAAAAFSPLKLAALERAVMAAKSFLIGLALVEQRITAEEAAQASQVEANAQTKLWGELENAHDLDNAAIRQILGAAACAALGA